MTGELFDVEAPDATAGNAAKVSVVLRVHVQPGAGRAQIVGRRGDALHVRVAPPPQDGRANVATIELLADALDVAKSAISLAAGATARDKRFRIATDDLDGFRRHLELAVEGAPSGTGRRSGRGRSA